MTASPNETILSQFHNSFNFRIALAFVAFVSRPDPIHIMFSYHQLLSVSINKYYYPCPILSTYFSPEHNKTAKSTLRHIILQGIYDVFPLYLADRIHHRNKHNRKHSDHTDPYTFPRDNKVDIFRPKLHDLIDYPRCQK